MDFTSTPLHSLRARRAREGLTLLELAVAMTLLSVAFLMYSSTTISANRQKESSREGSIASDAAREALENLRSVPLADVYASYNHVSADDPPGGKAPGTRFAVPGLRPIPGLPDDLIGEIHLPEMEVAPGRWELREDLQNPDLGMPRDLNGDSVIDSLNHATDYVHLPVRVTLTWQGRFGPRTQALDTMIVDYRR